VEDVHRATRPLLVRALDADTPTIVAVGDSLEGISFLRAEVGYRHHRGWLEVDQRLQHLTLFHPLESLTGLDQRIRSNLAGDINLVIDFL
jgi:hypothetical protein